MDVRGQLVGAWLFTSTSGVLEIELRSLDLAATCLLLIESACGSLFSLLFCLLKQRLAVFHRLMSSYS